MDTFYMDKRFQNMGRYVYCKSCYLRVRKIYTSYTVSFKLQKIPSRVKVKKKTNFRAVNHVSAYLIPTRTV